MQVLFSNMRTSANTHCKAGRHVKGWIDYIPIRKVIRKFQKGIRRFDRARLVTSTQLLTDKLGTLQDDEIGRVIPGTPSLWAGKYKLIDWDDQSPDGLGTNHSCIAFFRSLTFSRCRFEPVLPALHHMQEQITHLSYSTHP